MTESAADDRATIQRVCDGDAEAFAILVRKYQTRVRGYCINTLRDTGLGEDAAQDVFLKAYQALRRFRGDAAFSTWLYRIMVNHCRDLHRRGALRRAESWDAMLEEHPERAEALHAASDDTPQRLEQGEQLRLLLARLPEGHREILLLREAQGLSYEELAAALGCSLDAVKGRLKRARQALLQAGRHLRAGEDVETGGGTR
jgi:RNA polymerase sigma-70 factor (ECF subfamily)